MANPSTAHEPSMEEILASIRQIISEDGESSGSDEKAAAADAAPQAQEQEAPRPAAKGKAGSRSAAAAPPEPARREPAAHADAGSAAEEPARQDAPASSQRKPATARQENAEPAAQARDGGQLLSAGSDKAVSGAFSALAHTILAQNARTLEDLVTDMLRPMLQGWLNENLPSLVERLVKEEIDRVARRR